MISVIDYEMGNVGSILNMLRRAGVSARLTNSPGDIMASHGVILPGVGAFDEGIKNLKQLGLIEPLTDYVTARGKPLLGICLGMQLLTTRSEEGNLPGLGWIQGETIKFQFGAQQQRLRVPHMGWNSIRLAREPRATLPHLSDLLFRDCDPAQRYYFVHSYHVVCASADHVVATSHYGRDFSAAIGSRNIVGTQFHPEKSHKYGLKLMRNFAEFCAANVKA